MDKLEVSYLAGGHINGETTLKNCLAVYYKVKNTLTYNLVFHSRYVSKINENTSPTKKYFYTGERKDGGEIGGSGVHFPLHMGETPTRSTEEQREQPTVPQRL